jgi:hypothetical protein
VFGYSLLGATYFIIKDQQAHAAGEAWLAASFYPYIVPDGITAQAAAADNLTLVFMMVGIGMLIPIMIFYNPRSRGWVIVPTRGPGGFGRDGRADDRADTSPCG